MCAPVDDPRHPLMTFLFRAREPERLRSRRGGWWRPRARAVTLATRAGRGPRNHWDVELRTVIIGATGHIGTRLVPRLVREGHEVVAVSRGVRLPYHDSPEWRSVEQVILDRVAAERDASFGQAIAALRGDAVVDLTCFDPDSATHLVDALRGRLELFVHCGTLWVHGVPTGRPYDENGAAPPRWRIRNSQSPDRALSPGGRIRRLSGHGAAPRSHHRAGLGSNQSGREPRHRRVRRSRSRRPGRPSRRRLGDAPARPRGRRGAGVRPAVAHREAAIGEAFHIAAAKPVTMRSYAEAAASWFGRTANPEFLPWHEWRLTVGARDEAITHDHVVHSPHASIEKARSVPGIRAAIRRDRGRARRRGCDVPGAALSRVRTPDADVAFSPPSQMPELTSRLPAVGTTIFTVMSQLAADVGAVNLGQGFPDFDIPEPLAELLARAVRDGNNQYAPMAGLPALREAITACTGPPTGTAPKRPPRSPSRAAPPRRSSTPSSRWCIPATKPSSWIRRTTATSRAS